MNYNMDINTFYMFSFCTNILGRYVPMFSDDALDEEIAEDDFTKRLPLLNEKYQKCLLNILLALHECQNDNVNNADASFINHLNHP